MKNTLIALPVFLLAVFKQGAITAVENPKAAITALAAFIGYGSEAQTVSFVVGNPSRFTFTAITPAVNVSTIKDSTLWTFMYPVQFNKMDSAHNVAQSTDNGGMAWFNKFGQPQRTRKGDLTFPISQITGLQSALDAKLNTNDSVPTGLYMTKSAAAITGASLQASIDTKLNIVDTAVIHNQIVQARSQIAVNTANFSNYYLASNPSNYITTSALTPYLTNATAASTYQPIGTYATASNAMSFTNKTGNISQWTNDAGYLTSLSGAVPTSRTITINGTNQDLSANRTWSVGTLVAADTNSLSARINTKFTTPSGTTAQYIRGDGTLATLPTPGTGTVTSVATGLGLSGGTITTSGTILVDTASVSILSRQRATNTYQPLGSYLSAPTVDTISAARTFNTPYQMSTTRYTKINIYAQISPTLSLTGGQTGEVQIQMSPTIAGTYTTYGKIQVGNTGTLTIGLNITELGAGGLTLMVPPNYYWKAVTNNIAGSPSYTFLGGSKETY